ncbi:Glutamate--tRNA ligase [Thiomonas sp. X19]|uniref:glutamate--tRNA ligase n=1 Tax=Thiomonas sp. X19 TaxID=1050370 RepID=UPI000B728667|nr:glutamate--tRNA ligase [Thiomonas sp. X19]SCC92539.1 Glutamate--tRNA ligase [Thiomonas sp. X19]
MSATNPPIRTRFAPSPTGFIHLGNIRAALYPWAFARHHGGTFILRIEDTDVGRSTQEAVQVILDGMAWMGLDHDEGPFYQMQRMPRYREALRQLQDAGHVYPCYMSTAELDALRERQMAAGLKPRYDGTWRPEPGKTLPPVPAGVPPVLRFRTPLAGAVAWDDRVKGPVEFSNAELDDLVIARPDGTPTYNFCVVVDDIDMRITHVIRGDDHVNNTPRQIHIFRALGHEPPVYAHLPTVLNEQGEKLSKRNGAKSVLQYRDEGYLPDAMVNYLARLGWSHGDAEIFSREQFVQWFDLDHLGRSAAQFDGEKLKWVNAHYLRALPPQQLAEAVRPFLRRLGLHEQGVDLTGAVALLRERAHTLVEMAELCGMFYVQPQPDAALLAQHLTAPAQAALSDLRTALAALPSWDAPAIGAAMKQVLAAHQLKMPQLAMPLRLLVTGRLQTPSVDAVLALFTRDTVVQRLAANT